MDPFHAVKLASDALDEAHRRVQQETTGHPGRAKDPFYWASRTPNTDADLLPTKQQETIAGLFADSNFAETDVTWATHKDIVSAYRTAVRNEGKKRLRTESAS